jgi:hypothetical protein
MGARTVICLTAAQPGMPSCHPARRPGSKFTESAVISRQVGDAALRAKQRAEPRSGFSPELSSLSGVLLPWA